MAVKGSMLTLELPLKPHPEQEKKLNLILSACRSVHNDLTDYCKDILKINQDIRARFLEDGPSWENDGLSVKPDYLPIPTGFDLSDMAGTIRNGTPWMKDAYAACVRKVGTDVGKNVARYLDDLKNGVKRGLPRWKPEERFDTFTYAASNQYHFCTDWLEGRCAPKIYLGGVGEVHFCNEERARCLPKMGILKQAIVKKERFHNKDSWKLIIYYDTVNPKQYMEIDLEDPCKEPVGIDIGARKTAVVSDGTVVENLCLNERKLKEKAKLQQKISNTEKDSPERRKYLGYLNHMNKHIKDAQDDMLHKATRRLALEHDIIIMEDLKVTDINNLDNNHKTHRTFSDARPGEFRRMLGYKAAEAGAKIIYVDPAYTSQTCSRCGERTDPGSSELFICSHCGHSLDRDLNASRNILRRGMGFAIQGTLSNAAIAEGHR
ncbi:MAG: transposase, partial [archaeon]|nr:transposase [archaeon]